MVGWRKRPLVGETTLRLHFNPDVEEKLHVCPFSCKITEFDRYVISVILQKFPRKTQRWATNKSFKASQTNIKNFKKAGIL